MSAARPLSALLLLLAAGPGAVRAGDASAAAPQIAVCLPPQAGILEAILPGATPVVLIDRGQNPHTFEPSARQLALLSRCGLFFCSGLPFEQALLTRLRSLNPALRIVPAPKDEHDDEEGHEQEGEEHGHDPHFWTSPDGVLVMARDTAVALSEASPDCTDAVTEGLAAFKARVAEVDAELARRLEPFRGRAFLVYHPAWGHFAEHYGLRQLAVEHEGGSPTAKRLARLTETVRAERIGAILVQSDSEATRARPIAEPLGLAILRVNPLARDPLAILRETATAIETALSPQTP